MSLILFFVALFFGMLAARAGTVFARSGIQPTNLIIIIINFGAMLSTIAIIVFGFFSRSHAVLGSVYCDMNSQVNHGN